MSDPQRRDGSFGPADNKPEPEKIRPAYMPATLMMIVGLLWCGGAQAYAILAGGWKWSLVGLVGMLFIMLISAALQSHANRILPKTSINLFRQ